MEELMETFEILSDPEIVKVIKEGKRTLKLEE